MPDGGEVSAQQRPNSVRLKIAVAPAYSRIAAPDDGRAPPSLSRGEPQNENESTGEH